MKNKGEIDHQSRFDAWDRVLRAGALGWPWEMGWGGRGEGGSGWGTQVYPRLIHVNVWQNPLQCCKAISLKLKLKKKKDFLYYSKRFWLSWFGVGSENVRLPRWEPVCLCWRHKRHGFNPWVRKIPSRRDLLPTPVFMPGESHGERSQEGFSPGHWLKQLSVLGTCIL